ncbi:MAG TPA: efflux RND transporter periplasmic adaptor subunit [Caulobacteraceae bacterium]|jgi:multidrug efflux system membrane fusion protein|nr:efflux RND transporter periplasmic adaptor subunit [Caulobacteraceae bacterium]
MTEGVGEGPRPRSARSALRAGLLGGAALIVVLAVFVQFTQPRHAGKAKASAAPVRVGVVTRRDMTVIERSTGAVIAEAYVQVFPLVTGAITQQHFKEGQFVKKGDALFQIDPDPYRAAVAQARGTDGKDEASLQNAQRDQQRYETLYKQDSTSQQLRDTAIANTKVLVATVAADKAAIDAAVLNLKYTTIRSPIDGKTGPVLINPGNIVYSSNTPTALVTVAQVQPIKVSFPLPQDDLPRIQARQRSGKLVVRLETPGPNGKIYTAPVDFVSNAVNAQSGTIELRATFRNEDLALVPGQLVRVVVELGDLPQTLVVPRDAVNDSPSGPYVYAVERDKAFVKQVTVLFDDGANAAVTGELRPGETVVTEGQLRVDAGAPLHVLGVSEPPPKLASDKVHPAR